MANNCLVRYFLDKNYRYISNVEESSEMLDNLTFNYSNYR